METEAKYIVTPQPVSNMPMHAYVVMLHLVSQGYSDFTEIRKVLCRERDGNYTFTILRHIFDKIEELEKEWSESIPRINALVFIKDGIATEKGCRHLSGHINVQPTPKQVAEFAASVAAYDKWDKVLKAFREDACPK